MKLKAYSFAVPSEFDRRRAEELLQVVLGKVAEASPGSEVVLDFTGSRYVSSAGVSVVLRIFKECRYNDCKLLLVVPSQDIRALLEMTGLDRLVEILQAPPEEKPG